MILTKFRQRVPLGVPLLGGFLLILLLYFVVSRSGGGSDDNYPKPNYPAVDAEKVTEVDGAFIVTPPRRKDDRGFFQEHFHMRKYPFVSSVAQVSYSHSKQNVLRGLHVSPYGKLVQCISGSLVDVMVDLRKDSPTYLKWKKVELSADEPKQVYVPAGCGHGFLSLEDNTVLLYTQEGNYDANRDVNVNYADPTIGIEWPTPMDGGYILSSKDKESPFLKDTPLYKE